MFFAVSTIFLQLNSTRTQAESVFHDLIYEAMDTKATQVSLR